MIEGLIVGALLRVVDKVEERWLNDLADQITVDNVREVAKRALTLFKREPGTDQAERAAAELAAQISSAGPEVAQQLATPPAPVAQHAMCIEQFAEFLAYEFELALELECPVALPGFFNCTNCVAIIDARPRDMHDDPKRISTPSLRPDSLTLPLAEQALYLPTDPSDRSDSDTPMVWLIRTADGARRDALLGALNDRFLPPRKPPSMATFHLESDELRSLLMDEEAPQRVHSIDRKRVTVVEEVRATHPTTITTRSRTPKA